MSPSGLHVNKPAIFIIIGLIGGVVVWYKFYSAAPSLSLDTKLQEKSKTDLVVDQAVKTAAKLLELKSIKIEEGGQEFTLSYREVAPASAKFDILFLHGAAFCSENWATEPVLTLQLMEQLGYRAVAIDLPGKGKSTASTLDNEAYLGAVIKALKLETPVIVSPSMSGQYSLPYLFKDPGTALKRARGFVPVAPVSTADYVDKFKESEIPTLIIYGADDNGIGPDAVKHLQNLPKKTEVKLTGAGHACYTDKPTEFNEALKKFLEETLK